MNIPNDIKERILRETDIVEIVSETIPLKKAGVNFKGLCPFHGEKTPSFNVHPQKQMFHCFGCGIGGDVITFIMKQENLPFVEALEKLAKRLNITIPRSDNERVEVSQTDIYYKINAYAQWFFREEFKKNNIAKTYLKERGLTDAIVESFALGFAPDAFDGLLSFFNGKRIPIEKAAELGLLKRHVESGRHYDFYRNRITFPIRSTQGHIIGFGGRTLSGKEGEAPVNHSPPAPVNYSPAAKYINSPESPVYHKSRELYGLFENKKAILKTRQVVVVEGYVDVLACVQLGVTTAVAPLGTSLTRQQIEVLRRLADDIILMFDGDEAGRKAASKAFETCLEAGVHPKVVVLTDAKDPGELLHDQAQAGRLQALVAAAPYAMDWIFTALVTHMGAHPMARAKVLKSLLTWIARLPEEVQKMTWKKRLCDHFEIATRDINKVIENTSKFAKVAHPAAAQLSREELIVLAFVKQPELFAKENLSHLSSGFENQVLRELGKFLEDFYKKYETFETPVTISQAPLDMQGVLSRILTCAESYSDLSLRDLILQKQVVTRKKLLKEITAKIRLAEDANDTVLKMQLLAEKQLLLAGKSLEVNLK